MNYFKKLCYYKIENKVVHVQTRLDHWISFDDLTEEVKKKYDYHIETIERYPTDEELLDWINIVNDAYDDTNYNLEKAKMFFQNHLFLDFIALHFVVHNNMRIATVISGLYKEKPSVGGVCRIAIKKEYQKKGLGVYIILLGYSYLKGIVSKGESIIASKRIESLLIHFRIGFLPVYNLSQISYTGSLKNVNFIQKLRLKMKLKCVYNKFLIYFSGKFAE